MTTDPVSILLWRDLAIFLLFGALLGVMLGLVLIFKPQLLERINRVANRWVSTRHISRWLDRSISLERWFHQHHRAVGIAIVLGATYMLIYFGLLFDKAIMLQAFRSLQVFRGLLPANLLDALLNMLLDALVLGSLVGAAVALIVGLFLWFRPSLLRFTEEEANQWVTSRRSTKVLDVQHGEVDAFVVRHAQHAGWLLLLGSIYLFFALFRSLA